jgi:hypothetical protein
LFANDRQCRRAYHQADRFRLEAAGRGASAALGAVDYSVAELARALKGSARDSS